MSIKTVFQKNDKNYIIECNSFQSFQKHEWYYSIFLSERYMAIIRAWLRFSLKDLLYLFEMHSAVYLSVYFFFFYFFLSFYVRLYVRRQNWFWKSLSMTDRGGEFSIFRKDNVRTDKRLDIFISIRPMTMQFGEQVHLEEMNQMRLIKQVLVSPSRQDHVKK